MDSNKLQDIRREYSSRSLGRADMPSEPMVIVDQWINEAIELEVAEPTAMLVATATADGKPSMRTVLLKGIEEGRLVFYSNYESRKGEQIAENPQVALTFLWHELERQIHIEGRIERLTPQESDAYFHKRPYKSRIGARVSDQSRPIPSREHIMLRFAQEALLWTARTVPRPEHWGGWAVTPERIELWQGRDSRLHDRFLYLPDGSGGWTITRLAP